MPRLKLRRVSRRRVTERWRRALIGAAIALGSVLIAHSLSRTSFFQIVELKARDLQFLLRGQQSTPEALVLAIDQKSLDTIPDLLLFWHPYYADVIRGAAAGGAKVLALDVTFGIPVTRWEPNHDQALAAAVAETYPRMPVICGYVPAAMSKQSTWPVPVNMIAAAFGLAAFANLTADPDDFVRRQELLESPANAGDHAPLTRGLAFRAAEKYVGTDATFEGNVLKLGGRRVPAAEDHTILINFPGPPGTVPRVSFVDFMQAARAGNIGQLRRWVDGKAVFVGLDTPSEDRVATPFYTSFQGRRWNAAGVEVHASTFHTLISGHYLVPVSSLLQSLALLAAAALTAFAVLTFSAGRAALCFAGLILLAGVAVQLLFRIGYVLSLSQLILTCSVAGPVCLMYRFIAAERKGGVFRRAFALFVGKSVARSLDETGGVSLTTSRELATILFSDIRGFTAFCESKDPAFVVEVLNEYLAEMVRIIVAHEGHVNKFIGDGILAVFTTAQSKRDAVQRAVSCGIEMVTAPSQFRTGVGIHTGLVVLGNVGSAEKMEYTVLGDAVNTASRLESLNKEFKTSLLLSAATATLLDDSIETIRLDSVLIRGLSEPMDIYTAAALFPATSASAAGRGDTQ